MARKFYDLEIWQEGFDLLMRVYDVTAKYPKEEIFALTGQTRRSANSVIANIAEAHGRYHFADKVRVLFISRSEASETQSHLRVAIGRNYITQNEFMGLDERYEKLTQRINNYVRYLRDKSTG